ncbi:chromatin-associated RNAPIII regulator FPT1 Ecym_6324 [Eremothecium cymbalariae DBVPG|uniref:Uncharacterized protein n=1 Tax=Eremothecium cymbalariae (strain CBS 270.75 / DBVPG 7215 / KCTC 17166 / NRRL Y-17582) TaxID=931890 RepID=G8JUC0_ERECY|nr:hypothetical protein Ecym_6324 [Eremothecium cymbalariae DBVPG\
MEELYVYAGENMPRVKLCLLKRYPSVQEVIKFLGKTQDRYSVQLSSIETITGNLKIRCGMLEDCEEYPFYILEFNEVNKDYSLWKLADVDWKFGSVVASLYVAGVCGKGSGEEQGDDGFEKLPEELDECLKPEIDRGCLLECLRKLNRRVMVVDWGVFGRALDAMFTEKQVRGDDLVTLKGMVSLVALQTTVETSKRQLQQDLEDYDLRVRSRSRSQESTRTSSPDSILLPSSASRSSLISSAHYTYGMPATQLDTNFKAFFRSMAENFELFDEPQTVQRGRVSKRKKKCSAGRQPKGFLEA